MACAGEKADCQEEGHIRHRKLLKFVCRQLSNHSIGILIILPV